MSFQLHINNRVYSKNEVLKTTDRGFVIDFCKKWLKGTSSFKITSSGSTGSPKLLNIQRSQMITSARKTIEYFKLHKGTQAVLCMDPKFIGGMMMLVRALEGEWVLHVLTPAANPFIGNKSLPSFDFISLVPLQLREIIETGHGLELIQQARVVLVGGAEVGPWLTTRCLQLKPAIYSTYGMTETLSHIAVRQINGSNPDESFTTLPGIEIKSNEAGCLTICGDITFGKELVTRDRVEITESGQFKVLGRIDNVINSAGIKIQAEKVETQLELIFHNYPDTYTFFVGGIPHPRWGEQVTLFIDKNLPFWEDVKKKLSLHLNKYEVPKAFIVCPAFEMTPSGKINRKGTIAHFVKNQERKV